MSRSRKSGATRSGSATRLDQVGGDERVVSCHDTKRLCVMADEAGLDALRSGPDNDLVAHRHRATVRVGCESHAFLEARQLALAPADDLALDRNALGRRNRDIQLIDTSEQPPELEAAEHLLEL